jgi:hypothetical protein
MNNLIDLLFKKNVINGNKILYMFGHFGDIFPQTIKFSSNHKKK